MRSARLGSLGIAILAATVGSGATSAGQGPAPASVVRMAEAEQGAPFPEDLLRPEGRSRWDLRDLRPGRTWVRTTRRREGRREVEDRVVEGAQPFRHMEIREEGDRASVRPGSRRWFRELVSGDGAEIARFVDEAVVGIGWLHLPSGPRETVLLRRIVHEAPAGSRRYRPVERTYRWVDPRVGVVAEARFSVDGGAAPAGPPEVTYAEEVLQAAADLKIYVDELDQGPRKAIVYAWDRGPGTPVDSLTNPSFPTIGDLINADTWNFDIDANRTGTEVSSTTFVLTTQESCNAGQCGYFEGLDFGRQDKNFDGPPESLVKNNQVTEREDRAADVTIWLRAGAQKEGTEGFFGDGESRFCYTDKQVCQDDSSVFCRSDQDCLDRGLAGPCILQEDVTEVPLWRFGHQDAAGWYMQAGDAWESGVFGCEQNLYNQVCGQSGAFFDELWMKACADHQGKQTGEVLKGGVVTIPSGHTLNALLVRTVADFCVYSVSGCSFLFKVDEVRTVVYLWQVPHLGTVVLLQSPQEVPDLTSFTVVDETQIGFGLYPPLSIQVDGVTDTSVDLSWDPGKDTHRIDDYVVYWDSDSGSTSDYAFNSLTHPGQVTFAGTSATVSGLTPGTTYFFTVTSRSNFTNPSTGEVVTYESIRYPTQVSGDPDHVYPVEVQATTTGGACVPTEEVQNLTVDKVTGAIQICWDPVSDPCLEGYDVLGADSPESDANFAPVAQVGLETCWTGNPTQTYFLVVARGAGGTGPWGHYGR